MIIDHSNYKIIYSYLITYKTASKGTKIFVGTFFYIYYHIIQTSDAYVCRYFTYFMCTLYYPYPHPYFTKKMFLNESLQKMNETKSKKKEPPHLQLRRGLIMKILLKLNSNGIKLAPKVITKFESSFCGWIPCAIIGE